MDVEKTIEQLQAEAAASRAEFYSSMADVAKRHADAEARMDRAEARMDRFDKQLQATRKLVEAGMKIVTKLAQSQANDRKNFDYKINALIQAQDRLVQRLLHHRPNGRA